MLFAAVNSLVSFLRIIEVIGNVVEVVRNWTKYAECAGVGEQAMECVKGFHKY